MRITMRFVYRAVIVLVTAITINGVGGEPPLGKRQSADGGTVAAARSLQDSGRHAEAAAAFEAVLAENPKAQNSAVRLGRCREALGQRAEAIAAYRRAIDIEPDSYEASKAT
jgi:tetratricopeptide (TPR) repeat protein